MCTWWDGYIYEKVLIIRSELAIAGIDVTEAELVAQTSWRRQEKTELVGAWKAKVYDMHHVQVNMISSKWCVVSLHCGRVC